MNTNNAQTNQYIQKHELFLSKNKEINFFLCPQNSLVFELVNKTLDSTEENLILVTGSDGVGKTHLVGSILQNKAKKFLCVDTSDFISTSYSYLKQKKPLQEFFNWLLSFDILLFDDFHLIKGKETINEIFLMLIGELKRENKKAFFIYTSYKGSIELYEDILACFDRQINYPNVDKDSLKIIAIKFLESYNKHVKITKTALDYLLEVTEENIQTLLDKVIKILLYYEHINTLTLVGVDEIKKILNRITPPKKENRKSQESVQQYAERLCKRLGFNFEEILEGSRKKDLVYKRNLAIYLLKKKLNLSHEEIGLVFNKNHSTITHSIKQIEEKRKDKYFDEYVKTFL